MHILDKKKDLNEQSKLPPVETKGKRETET